MRIQSFLVAACLLAALPAISSDRRGQLDKLLDHHIHTNSIPCMAVAVVQDGVEVYRRIAGSQQPRLRQDCREADRFPLLSTSKIFTGSLLLRLQQSESIQLATSVRRYVPELPPAWDQVTLEELANEALGLPELDETLAPATDETLLKQLPRVPVRSQGNLASSSGGTAYALLQLVVERATDRHFSTLLNAEVLAPLNLNQTGFDYSNLVKGFSVEGQIQAAVWDVPTRQEQPSVGLTSTVGDMSRFLRALHRQEFLRNESRRLLAGATNRDRAGSRPKSLGWTRQEIRGRQALVSTAGPAIAQVMHFPQEDLSLVVLTSSVSLFPYLGEEIARHFFSEVRATDPRPSLHRDDDLAGWLSQALQGLFASGKDGAQLPEERLSEQGRRQFLPLAKRYLPSYLRALGPVKKVELVNSEQRPGGELLEFRLTHADQLAYWRLDLNDRREVDGFTPILGRPNSAPSPSALAN